MKEIVELVGVSTAERPIKGFALDKALYVAGTKQDVLDEQSISQERVANLVVWAKDIAKFMVFNSDGSAHEEKDLPSGDVDVSDFASLAEDNAFKGSSTYEGSTSEPQNLMNREAVEALVSGGSAYDGDGFGVPGKTLVEDGTVVQTQITGNYRNNSDKAGNLTINVRTDDGVKNWRFYYSIPRGSISARKVYVKVDEKAGTNKIINSGETWQCEVKAGQFFDEFFWSQVMDSASTFITPEEAALLIAKNNLLQADLQARFGAGTVEVNNLEFTVDSITANNLNGDN
ncbi:hypothetical protein VP121E341_P0017 [Vibrio phage 121E34-1]|nr:hypothetical protein VP121E341_P0017 [Vibrio phage 121E34-1]CAH9011664.1 hypothetical protein VP131E341_P0017 [Vibrio phage 131E34-1]